MIQDLPTMRKVLQSWVPGFSPDEYDRAINRAYDEIAHVHPWKKLEREFQFATKGYYDTGGVHFANAATDVTAADSVSAAWANTASTNYDFAGMFIKKNTNDEVAYYTITSNDSVEITLTSNYLGKTTTAATSSGDSYFIFKHIYKVDSNIETVTHLMGDGKLLFEDEKYKIEDKVADFDWEGSPTAWFNYGVNSANECLVQLYPPKVDDVYEMRGWGQLRVETLSGSAKPLLDSNLIVAFAEVELMKRKKMISPNSISDDHLKDSIAQAQMKLTAAVEMDRRHRTPAKYVQDRMFRSTHPGQKNLVEHDPWDF